MSESYDIDNDSKKLNEWLADAGYPSLVEWLMDSDYWFDTKSGFWMNEDGWPIDPFETAWCAMEAEAEFVNNSTICPFCGAGVVIAYEMPQCDEMLYGVEYVTYYKCSYCDATDEMLTRELLFDQEGDDVIDKVLQATFVALALFILCGLAYIAYRVLDNLI